MNIIQKRILAIYLPITVVILAMHYLFPGEKFVSYFKYAAVISLLLATTLIKKEFPEQKRMNLAIFFIVVADFFLVFSSTIPQLGKDIELMGIGGFFLAYAILITVYQKNFQVRRSELTVLIPILAIFLPVYFILYPYIKGVLLYLLTLFGIVLCYMAWTSVSTIFRGYFSTPAARIMAISGSFMLISDMGVAFALFYPSFRDGFVPWLSTIIWGTYIPAWTMVAYLIADKKLLKLDKPSPVNINVKTAGEPPANKRIGTKCIEY